MPQHDLFTDHPTTTLVLEVHDMTLLGLTDATQVWIGEGNTKGDRHWLAVHELCGTEQDLLETLLQRVLIAHRYGTPEDVRRTSADTVLEAREHRKGLERGKMR